MPCYCTWNALSKSFQCWKQGTPVQGHPNVLTPDALGRICTAHPDNDECLSVVDDCHQQPFALG